MLDAWESSPAEWPAPPGSSVLISQRRRPLAPLAPHQPRHASCSNTRWSAEAWSVVRVEFRRVVALRSEIRRAGWFN